MAEDSLVLVRPSRGKSAEARLRRFTDNGPPLPDDDIARIPDGAVLARVRMSAGALRARANAVGGSSANDTFIEPNRAIQRATSVQTGSRVAPRAGPMTWGLERIGITGRTRATGRGAVVAVLDSGLDFEHPDFSGRVDASDVGHIIDTDPQDPDGHGTHCAGIIAGPAVPSFGPRYGVAPGARLLIANIYESGKQSSDWHLLRGMLWAADRGAHVISLSLRTTSRDEVEPHSPLFEAVAQYLLDHGTLIVAAAGNASDRWEPFLGPIEHPADCPSIIAVGALNRMNLPARFSSGGSPSQRIPTLGAPGVAIDSAYTRVRSGSNPPYRTLTGTSQAAPHVAGVAALWVEKGFRGRALRDQLLASALPADPSFSERGAGAGLVQAPR